MRERGKFYCCFMALLKLNSGMGSRSEKWLNFEKPGGDFHRREKGLEQLKQLISFYPHVWMCVSVYGFNVCFLFFLLGLERKFPLNLNGKFIFGAKLKEDFRFENQVCCSRNGGGWEKKKQISCILLDSNQFTSLGLISNTTKAFFLPKKHITLKYMKWKFNRN